MKSRAPNQLEASTITVFCRQSPYFLYSFLVIFFSFLHLSIPSLLLVSFLPKTTQPDFAIRFYYNIKRE